MIEEPDFSTEKELEDAIAAVAYQSFGNADHVVVLRGFGLDIAVFSQTNGRGAVHLFEVKAFAQHHGRCSLGNQRGKGNQVRLLFDHNRNAPRLVSELRMFDHSIRWVLGNRSDRVGSARYLFFTCREAQAAAMGGMRPDKQNNLRLTAFGDQWITWRELVAEIGRFLSHETPTDPSRLPQ